MYPQRVLVATIDVPLGRWFASTLSVVLLELTDLSSTSVSKYLPLFQILAVSAG